MKVQVNRVTARAGSMRHAIRCGVSATALCVVGLAGPALAQDADPNSPTGAVAGGQTAGSASTPTANSASSDVSASGDTRASGEDIVITGIRQSLANAQNIKRNSDTVVDAITATDIGALPDRSVTEALQRVPGVAINRFAGSNDPDHFSAEGSGVTVRGLNFVRSEFNGRDAFAAGVGGQSINFADVPAELLGSVEIYKNATAENIEGGLAGTVNLNTRKPFDNSGFHLGLDAEANYGDFEKKWTPTGSLLVSDTFDTGIGRIGLLADVAYSRLKYRSDGIQISNFQTRDNQLAIAANSIATQVCRNPLPGTVDTTTQYNADGSAAPNTCGGTFAAGSDGYLDPTGTRYAPIGGQFRTQDFDRKRDGQAFAFQWESNDKKELLTLQFLRTHTTLDWGERTFESGSDLSEYNTYPDGCQFNTDGPGGTTAAKCPVGTTKNYTYDDSGLFQKGYVTYPGGGYRGGIPTGSGGFTAPGASAPTAFVPAGGLEQSLTRRQVHEENTIKDWGANLKIHPDDSFSINLDGDYTQARHQQLDVTLAGATFADQELDLTGNLPSVTPHKPRQLGYNFGWASPAPYPVLVAESDAEYFRDPRVQFWRNGMDHIEDSTGREYAFKLDMDKRFDDGFIRDIKFGARYADRNETVRYSTYNWGVLSETWAGDSPVTLAQQGLNQTAYYNFPDFFRGATAGPPGAFYYTGDLIKNYDQFLGFARDIGETWKTTNNAGNQSNFLGVANRPGVIPGSSYLPSEIQEVTQSNADAYAQLNFRSDDFAGVRFSGNIGVRFVNTQVRSAGAIQITAQNLGVNQTFDARCGGGGTPPQGVPPGVVIAQPGGVCNVGATPAERQAYYASLQQFAGVQTVTGVDGEGQPVSTVQPIPGAAAVTPNIANNGSSYFLPSLNLKFEVTPTVIVRFAASRVLTLPDLASVRNSFTASLSSDNVINFSLGNPYLKPATANQFDATFEWYFARVGSLTIDAFYKDITNFFYANQVLRSFTQNGVTLPVQVRIADNYSGHGKIKGVEVAYQQTFDFLPSLLNGFGVNASYTYLDSSGLPNSFLQGGSAAHVSNFAGGNLPLEQLSKHTVNAEVFYEKGPVSLRAAYNWRSRFLLTAADVIFPYAPIFNDATGTLDASAFLNLTKQIKIGVQGVNLTNEVTKTLQAYTGNSDQLAPRSYFVNDRRFSFILRGNF